MIYDKILGRFVLLFAIITVVVMLIISIALKKISYGITEPIIDLSNKI